MLSVAGLRLTYGSVKALDDVSVEVAEGVFLGLLGPSGCGKTSLLRVVAGFVRPDAGRVAIAGRDVTGTPARERDLGVVFQSYALFPHMTAAENVRFGLDCRGVAAAEARRRVGEALDLVGLADQADRKPRQLSGGQQQRVALARALVVRPRLLLLDESLSALDKKLRVQMQTELKALQRRVGVTTIFVTHDQEEALAMADQVGVMDHGRLIQVDAPELLYEAPRNAYVADFVGGGNVLPARVRGHMAIAETPSCEAHAPAPDRPDGAPARLFVRAERLAMEQDHGAGLVVTGRRFLGALVEILAAPDGGRPEAPAIRALVPSEAADGLVPGVRVRACARDGACRLLESD
jgi:ABC-type Fe3+/spermidine/putrescine transport system ATPase subunit